MTALDLLHHLHEHDVSLTLSPDGTVHCRAPKGVLTPALLDAIRQYKQELLALLAQSAADHDTAATEPSLQEAYTQQEYVPSPPPYPGHPMGAPFRPGQQVWLYRWDNHAPRFDAPVTVLQMRMLWPGEQDIGWCDGAGEVTWHNARLAIAVETQQVFR